MDYCKISVKYLEFISTHISGELYSICTPYESTFFVGLVPPSRDASRPLSMTESNGHIDIILGLSLKTHPPEHFDKQMCPLGVQR